MHNVGKIDRIIRLALALTASVLYFTGTISGTIGNVIIVIAGVLLLTSMKKCCPLYALLGFGTCGTSSVEETDIKVETKKLNFKK